MFILIIYRFLLSVVRFLCVILRYLFDKLIDYIVFYVIFKNILLIKGRHHYIRRAEKLLGAYGILAKRDLYRVIPVMTQDLFV